MNRCRESWPMPDTPVAPKPALKPDQPNPSRRLWLVGAVVLTVAIAAGAWWQYRASSQTEVTVEQASLGPVTRVLAVNGRVAARDSVQIRAAVSGTVLDLMAAEGDRVAKGDVLARLDASQQAAAVRQAQSALGQGLAQQTQAAASYGRARDLGGLVARAALEEAQLALDSAAEEVARLRALLDQAEIQLTRYTVRAPIDGTVMLRSVDPGQLVDPTMALFTLADLSMLLVETDVDEAYATQIAPGQVAQVQLVGTTVALPGKVSFVAPRVDPGSGGLAVKITLDAPLSAPVGLTVTANVVVDETIALTVPRSALQGGAVFLLVGGKARLTPVKVIEWPAARLIVTEGLAEGDAVIVDATGLTDGQAVVVAKAATVAVP